MEDNVINPTKTYGEAVRRTMTTLPQAKEPSVIHTSTAKLARPKGVPPATVIRASVKPDFFNLFTTTSSSSDIDIDIDEVIEDGEKIIP